ncbi:hypothetical protein CcaverHIS002_0312250 [Cutaneotrichosporon cavernicola]|uniref:Prolyl 4-hydroxylase alpha subunit domain-containing protein n=1 Tax=Cutaneotrichosporon cavernicola TaxID=279322 RepID=A0AA48QVD0_9TREE|nr:uncharacterized protein CcaverHIS019_0312120 [Cutaneotrichosporon cavernicola]BEI83357.1 hypothetical protein CcaverHIS002_0312250 [Cutaneotrichosporon cavernicola]BEI91142.1 hypothetical protein CcaverHIS019_0312120 [Cutaneotrichosporon cavernicola]BEI98919.1 hypothetical protein CcaverHIS631_0312180 [Cutaneotrichosporon cavernicola]BEJ06693.1 hypothetical protein CcaverHIS641_0312150 [Cutaneotrichosporon cavernicola]
MPSTVRPRSPGPETERKAKKAKADVSPDITLPEGTTRHALHETYEQSTPYKHIVVPGLLTDELLESVVEETKTYGVRGEEGSLAGWGWEQKETDIYKIQQTPDLASLDEQHLPEETLEALPCITRLKEALYSHEFRNFVRDVTGCGPLSGKKTDCSVGLYTKGSHLLLHDDSISTRVISYILYLPNSPLDAPASDFTRPADNGKFLKGWDPKWGGSLELFPVENGDERGLPGTKAVASLPVKWGQIIFFQVQPGRSYHSVEEVIVGDGRRRLGVSGWFHRPIEGEEGFGAYANEKAQRAALSSLAQITAAPTIPMVPYTADPPAGLTPSHLSFLKDFLAPSYLTPQTLEKLSGQFVEASEIVLHNFLRPDLADKIKAETKAADAAAFGDSKLIPGQDVGEGDGWVLQGPASKHRFASLVGDSKSTPALRSVLAKLLPSEAWRAWLGVVSSLAPMEYRAEARRFRRGLDYTLANGEERTGEARLDAFLGLSWWADVPAGSDEEDALIEHGGWECYLAAPDASEDPETYQSALAKRAAEAERTEAEQEAAEAEEKEAEAENGEKNGEDDKADGPKITMGGVDLEFDPDQFSDGDFDTDSEGGDDGPLLTQPVSFNRLLLVLRDPGVMRFVKYLSAAAPGSRWDVGGEWEVGMLEEEDEEEGKEATE